MNEEKQKIGIDIRPENAGGTYSNLAIITHSQNEFILDFASMLPGLQKALLGSRVIMSPVNVKNLLNALRDNIEAYEKNFGPITPKIPGNGTFNMGGGFGNGTKS